MRNSNLDVLQMSHDFTQTGRVGVQGEAWDFREFFLEGL